MISTERLAECLLVAKAAAVVAVAWFAYTALTDFLMPKPDLTIVATLASPAPALRGVKLVDAKLKKPLKVYAPEAKKKLALPSDVIVDNDMQVVNATTVKATERPTSVTVVVDGKTGETKSYVKEEAYPWIATENRGEIGVAYGVKLRRGGATETTARLSVRQDILQVKGVHIGVNITADSDRDVFAGVGLSYKW